MAAEGAASTWSMGSLDVDVDGHHSSAGTLGDITKGAASIGAGRSQPSSQKSLTKLAVPRPWDHQTTRSEVILI